MLQIILALGALLAPHPVLRSRRIAVGMNEASQAPPSPVVVSVVLPEGKAAGDLLLIQPPRGAQCQVVVPEGVAPGQSFSVQLPPTVSAVSSPPPPPPPPPPPLPPPPLSPPPALAEPSLLGNFVTPETNPYVTSKARRVRAKFGDDAAGFVDLSDSGERAKLSRLESDLAQFKAERGLADRRLAGGAAAELQEEEEATPLARVINTLGTVLTFNFFVIILFFAWFLTGVGLQFGAHDEAVMNTFRTAWDPLILPLLSTHMALTFLSAGLERLAKPAEEG
ncbi:hypothetical protein EMIHUDRAFT_435251, partial [Emiliania huxleyi CCMP1516]|uniref:Uncharacterized protein n=2 Tax=Emiliania huxleyi TaxID=2903 RepID=A0A0D3JNJ0_EMIH1